MPSSSSRSRQCRVHSLRRRAPLRLAISQGSFAPAPEWYWNFWHRVEAERGLDALEDLLMPGPVHRRSRASCADVTRSPPPRRPRRAPGEDVCEGAAHGAQQALAALLPQNGTRVDSHAGARRPISSSCGAAAGVRRRSIIAGYPGSPTGAATP